MSKRAPQFERHERDLYLTPEAAVLPLKRFVRPGSKFYEPCAADGTLAWTLSEELGLDCIGMSDIEPLFAGVKQLSVFEIRSSLGTNGLQFITNPPWERKLLHLIIDHLKWIAPTWLLIDSDWLFTKQAAEFIPDATHIVAIGRVKWMPDSDNTGKDNSCWVRFMGGHDVGPKFYPNW